MKVKNDELSRANDDIRNLLDSTEIATLFVDDQLKVMRFTPKTTKIINLIPSDIGRSITDLVTHIKNDTLVDNIREVIETLVTKEVQIETKDGDCYVTRIMPYRTIDNKIKGVVVTFSNISTFMHAIQELQATQDETRASD